MCAVDGPRACLARVSDARGHHVARAQVSNDASVDSSPGSSLAGGSVFYADLRVRSPAATVPAGR
eukprot:2459122-Prymnesium_polylepis.1